MIKTVILIYFYDKLMSFFKSHENISCFNLPLYPSVLSINVLTHFMFQVVLPDFLFSILYAIRSKLFPIISSIFASGIFKVEPV